MRRFAPKSSLPNPASKCLNRRATQVPCPGPMSWSHVLGDFGLSLLDSELRHSSRHWDVYRAALKSLRDVRNRTADLSTSLRSGRDDKGEGGGKTADPWLCEESFAPPQASPRGRIEHAGRSPSIVFSMAGPCSLKRKKEGPRPSCSTRPVSVLRGTRLAGVP